jgi:site-specific DNA recombinase
MVAGCYARKSNDEGNKDADAKSVTRQIARAREFAEKQGWTFSDDHVFTDDGISGAEFKRRPGLTRLLTAVQDKASTLTHLIVSEQSRLGRDTIRTLALIQGLADHGVEVWSYLENKALHLDDEMAEVEQFMKSWAGASERRKASQRVRDTLRLRAEQGRTTGGRVLGYATLGGQRNILPSEAVIVTRIFEMRAAGYGYYRIARALEAEGFTSPRGRGKWSTASIGAILRNPLYTGTLVWGRTKTMKRHGTSTTIDSPEDVIERRDENLRIIPDALWTAVQQANQAASEGVWQDARGHLKSRPTASRHLLTPFLQCVCGGAMHVRTDKRGDYYFCTRRHLQGKAACPSAKRLPVTLAEKAVIYAFEEALAGGVVMERLQATLDAYRAAQVDPEPLRKEAAALKAEITRLVDAVAGGKDIPEIGSAIATRRTKLEAIEARLASTAMLDGIDVAKFRGEIEAALTDLKAHLRKNPSTGQAVLRRILPTRVVFKPSQEPGVAWDFTFESNYEKVLEDVGLGAVKDALAKALRLTSYSCGAPRRAGWSRR